MQHNMHMLVLAWLVHSVKGQMLMYPFPLVFHLDHEANQIQQPTDMLVLHFMQMNIPIWEL